MIVLKKKLGVENLEVVDCEGKGGGLAVLWRRGISVVLKGKSKNHIDVKVLETGGQKWWFTGIYGEPELKYKTWELMEWLKDQDNEQLPWLCAGHFNEVLFHHEKEGGFRGLNLVLIASKVLWRYVNSMILVSLVTFSLGEISKP